MKLSRLFNLVIATALFLLLIIGLTVREATATTAVAARMGSSEQACAYLPSRYSIRSEYAQAMDAWVIVTEDGPTGVDGGLVQFLSDVRTCSK